jgi:choline dehydrogenase
MCTYRGTKQSYDRWANLTGDTSYQFANLLPYFKKSVTFTPPNTTTRFPNATAQYDPSAYSSPGGPLQVSYANYASPFSTWLQAGLKAIGIPSITDFNTGSLLGAQYCSSTIDPSSESRDSSQTSFLDAASGRSNLATYTGTLAKKIIFNSKKVATGVQVSTAGISYTLNARKEVIVSAGAFQSPQLLMVSGIGPAAQLQSLNIPVIANRSGVGQNMQDHIFFGPSYRVNVETLTKLANDPVYLATELAVNYALLKQGPITNPVSDFLGWEKVPASLRSGFSSQTKADLATFPADWPEIEYISGSGYVGDYSNLFTNQPKDGYQYGTILATLVAPLSRGSVSLTSADTNDLPLIDPGWLTSPTDQQVAVAAYKRARAAFASSGMAPVVIGQEYYPGPAVQTDAQILSTIRNDLMTVWHAACTCAMGLSSDPKAVLDSSARVIGVSGVRVVDASSFPILPPGHPQSTIYALAEKISDLIKKGL